MDNELFTNPIKDQTWTAACGGKRCCIEVAELEGGAGFALRNSQSPGQVIRASAEELKAFQTLIPGLLEEV